MLLLGHRSYSFDRFNLAVNTHLVKFNYLTLKFIVIIQKIKILYHTFNVLCYTLYIEICHVWQHNSYRFKLNSRSHFKFTTKED